MPPSCVRKTCWVRFGGWIPDTPESVMTTRFGSRGSTAIADTTRCGMPDETDVQIEPAPDNTSADFHTSPKAKPTQSWFESDDTVPMHAMSFGKVWILVKLIPPFVLWYKSRLAAPPAAYTTIPLLGSTAFAPVVVDRPVAPWVQFK